MGDDRSACIILWNAKDNMASASHSHITVLLAPIPSPDHCPCADASQQEPTQLVAAQIAKCAKQEGLGTPQAQHA